MTMRNNSETTKKRKRKGSQKLRRLHAEPAISTVAEHRDRLTRFGAEYLEAALSAQETTASCAT